MAGTYSDMYVLILRLSMQHFQLRKFTNESVMRPLKLFQKYVTNQLRSYGQTEIDFNFVQTSQYKISSSFR